MPVVVTVNGNVESMFFSCDAYLEAHIDESSSDGRSIKALCNWLGINCKSMNSVTEQDCNERIISALSHSKSQLGDDPGIALSRSEQVTPKEDFDCSDASLESEGEYINSPELSDEFNFA